MQCPEDVRYERRVGGRCPTSTEAQPVTDLRSTSETEVSKGCSNMDVMHQCIATVSLSRPEAIYNISRTT
jgi:hypothetical protein